MSRQSLVPPPSKLPTSFHDLNTVMGWRSSSNDVLCDSTSEPDSIAVTPSLLDFMPSHRLLHCSFNIYSTRSRNSLPVGFDRCPCDTLSATNVSLRFNRVTYDYRSFTSFFSHLVFRLTSVPISPPSPPISLPISTPTAILQLLQ